MPAIAPDKVEELRGRLPELEAAMGYDLWDAIREGSTVTHQAVGTYVGPAGELCALSAAMLALTARHML